MHVHNNYLFFYCPILIGSSHESSDSQKNEESGKSEQSDITIKYVALTTIVSWVSAHGHSTISLNRSTLAAYPVYYT